jgi:hypothetical protein
MPANSRWDLFQGLNGQNAMKEVGFAKTPIIVVLYGRIILKCYEGSRVRGVVIWRRIMSTG